MICPMPPISPTDVLVYFAQAIEGDRNLIKIGSSIHPQKRLRTIGSGLPMLLNLLGTCFGGQELEHKLHRYFDRYRVHGEWFQEAHEIMEWIERHCEKYDSPRILKKRTSEKITPPRLAREWGVREDRILNWIRSGRLRAIDLNQGTGKRPRYLIGRSDVATLEAFLSVQPPTPRARPRRNSNKPLVEYV